MRLVFEAVTQSKLNLKQMHKIITLHNFTIHIICMLLLFYNRWIK